MGVKNLPLSVALAASVASGGLLEAEDPFVDALTTFTATEFPPRILWSGRVNAIALHPMSDDEVFVTTQTGGLFKSLDGGDTWTHVDSLPPFFTNDVAYAPNDPDVVIVTAEKDNALRVWVRPDAFNVTASNGGIWISRDSGLTWFQPGSSIAPLIGDFSASFKCPENFTANGISVASPKGGIGKIYVATDCGVSVSDDEGLSWSHMEIPYARNPRQNGQSIFSAVAAWREGV